MPWHYVAKPSATLCAGALAVLGGGASRRYRRALAVGLLLSALGDILLMLPRDLFAAGLGAFLCAHIAYLVAFSEGVGVAPRRGPFLVYAAIAAAVLSVLWPGIPAALRMAVMAYVAVLAAMAAQAAARWGVLAARVATTAATRSARLAAMGGAVFVVSDASLAIDRFRWPFAAAPAVVLGTYWIAQTCIALSAANSRALQDSATASST
jgi:uncharacterized membrane protein YhhN